MKRRFMFIFVTMMILSSFCLFNSTSVSANKKQVQRKHLRLKSLVKMRKYLGSLIILKL